MTYDPLYLRGVAAFNGGRFFEAHEVWETLWRATHGEDRRFYKGLVQAAVALHHRQRGNLRGAETLLGRAAENLIPYGPLHLGLAVDGFLVELRRCIIPGDHAAPADPPTIRLSGDV